MIAKDDIDIVRETVLAAYLESGRMAAAFESGEPGDAKITAAFDGLCTLFERGTILLRNLCEKTRESTGAPPGSRRGPKSRIANISGDAEINDFGWLHIKLNSLLPHCRFGAPAYVTDTVTRLLDGLERNGRALPRFDEAMLVIEERCDMGRREVFDQDNKAWKAVPNAFKGRLIPDDDRFTLDIALISERSDKPACHIYLLPRDETGDFFFHKECGCGSLM